MAWRSIRDNEWITFPIYKKENTLIFYHCAARRSIQDKSQQQKGRKFRRVRCFITNYISLPRTAVAKVRITFRASWLWLELSVLHLLVLQQAWQRGSGEFYTQTHTERAGVTTYTHMSFGTVIIFKEPHRKWLENFYFRSFTDVCKIPPSFIFATLVATGECIKIVFWEL